MAYSKQDWKNLPDESTPISAERLIHMEEGIYNADKTANEKVDKVEGKGLSTNDFTNDFKNKLNGIEEGANKTVVDNALSASSTNPVQNKVVNETLGNKLATNGDASNTTVAFTEATTLSKLTTGEKMSVLFGKVSKAISTLISHISTSATASVLGHVKVDDSLSLSSTNPVQNKIVTEELNNKVEKVDGKGLSTNDYTTEEKEKLKGIESGANKTTVDSALSSTSTNPVQNKVVNDAVTNKADEEIISDAWNASTTYAVGQYCIYNNSLWKCLVQHNGQTPTEGTYWTNVTVASEIASVNSSLNWKTLKTAITPGAWFWHDMSQYRDIGIIVFNKTSNLYTVLNIQAGFISSGVISIKNGDITIAISSTAVQLVEGGDEMSIIAR